MENNLFITFFINKMISEIKCLSCDEVCYYPCEKIGGLLGLHSDFTKILKTKVKNGENTDKIENLIQKLTYVLDEFDIENKEKIKGELLKLNTITLHSGTVITWQCRNSHRHQYILNC